MSDNEKNLNEVEKNENLNKEQINENEATYETSNEKTVKDKICEFLTSTEVMKNIVFFYIAFVIAAIFVMFVPSLLESIYYEYHGYDYDYEYPNESQIYANEYLKTTIEFEEADDEIMLIKCTIENTGNEDLSILENKLDIEKILCKDKCNYSEMGGCDCTNLYMSIYDCNEKNSLHITLESKTSRTFEYKVRKELINIDNYKITSNVICEMTY